MEHVETVEWISNYRMINVMHLYPDFDSLLLTGQCSEGRMNMPPYTLQSLHVDMISQTHFLCSETAMQKAREKPTDQNTSR